MKEYKLLTAVGNIKMIRNPDGKMEPVVICDYNSFPLDPQEMAVWNILIWKIMDMKALEHAYERLIPTLPALRRSLKFCIERMQALGIVAVGTGKTEEEARYDLLSDLYIMPADVSFRARMKTFVKLVVLKGISPKRAASLLRRYDPSFLEREIVWISEIDPISTAEPIKCLESDIGDEITEDNLMDAICGDGVSTSDNLPFSMKESPFMLPVITAVSNLYLHRQIIFDRVTC